MAEQLMSAREERFLSTCPLQFALTLRQCGWECVHHHHTPGGEVYRLRQGAETLSLHMSGTIIASGPRGQAMLQRFQRLEVNE